ncbi:hypothetical protein D6T63_14695 [Arthrobacter cheniae]|uniref:Uncharacterized protein n=1 Tax=Arthrobacter cheniae TaxID=1258888 RepID=A0A3A5MB61_9MICC|nr:hypothetical protein [Arthrobacter cheniae]RJT77792.1 hypothetical protein D6T63_14695 [Arthrobacter cheniae]
MTWSTRVGIVALTAVLLAACATPGDPGGEPDATPGVSPAASPSQTPAAPAGEFSAPAADGVMIGQGTVLQVGGAAPQFCLGGIAESYPPQCTGPEIADWDWAQAQQSETASDVTWGAYAATGTWNGTVFTRTGVPIPLALYDTVPLEDPLAGRQGSTGRQDLDRILQEIGVGEQLVASGVRSGFVTVTVVYDDGSIQAHMDAEYGPDVVVVLSALRSA